MCLELGESHLDGIEVWAIGRQREKPSASFLEDGLSLFALMAGKIVEDDDVAWTQRRRQLGFDVGFKENPVHGLVDEPWCRRARPRALVIFVVVAVSSMNTRRWALHASEADDASARPADPPGHQRVRTRMPAAFSSVLNPAFSRARDSEAGWATAPVAASSFAANSGIEISGTASTQEIRRGR